MPNSFLLHRVFSHACGHLGLALHDDDGLRLNHRAVYHVYGPQYVNAVLYVPV